MNEEEIQIALTESRQIIIGIIEAIQNKKKLNENQEFYARFLYNNKMIDTQGNITKEGINALYH